MYSGEKDSTTPKDSAMVMKVGGQALERNNKDGPFILDKFRRATPCFFEAIYGPNERNALKTLEEVEYFTDIVLRGTNNQGVHLVIDDGGINVCGEENLQVCLHSVAAPF